MSSVTIGWNENIDPVTGLVSQGPADFNSLSSAVRTGLAAEHVWPSSSGLAGAHLQGSARIFVGPNSQVSSADTSGRLMLDSTNSQLWYVGGEVATPYALGNQRGLSVISVLPPLPSGRQFYMSVVSVTQATWPSGPIGIGAFQGNPFVFASLATTDVSDLTFRGVTIASVTPSNVVATVWNKDGSHSTLTATVHIMSVGIV